MNKPRTATTKVVTEINRTAILDALRLQGPLSRASIGRHTGLSPATVERLCSALVEAGLIVVDGYERSSGGRPYTATPGKAAWWVPLMSPNARSAAGS